MVGALKMGQCTAVELGVTARGKARAREWNNVFFSVFKSDTDLCVALLACQQYDINDVRTTAICDLMMIYCKERYMENMS